MNADSGSPKPDPSALLDLTGVGRERVDDIFRRFSKLTQWNRNGSRAPHKPLLALWAIGRCLAGEPRLASFDVVDRELAPLLKRFAPRRKGKPDTQDPFWRMRNDGVWEIPREDLMPPRPGKKAYRKDLLAKNIEGGLLEADYDAFRQDPSIAWRLAEYLVDAHFPETLHGAVLSATGIHPIVLPRQDVPFMPDDYILSRRRRRDPRFRHIVLDAYGSRCAVCRFAVGDGSTPFALEAAHIKWHLARGPDRVSNGLALCALHHELFDEGAFTLLPGDYKVAVASVAGGEGFDDWLGRFSGEPLKVWPAEENDLPDPRFLAWHRRWVFLSPESIPKAA